MNQSILEFPPFRLDMDDAALWRGARRVPLPARELAVLHYLATHPGRLVTAEELLTQVWSNVKVSSGVLKVRIARIRRALGDSGQSPRFIENVHGKGYRFLPTVTTTPPVPSPQSQVPSSDPQHSVAFVGRERELAELRTHLEDAINGHGRITLLTGEPGIGKTRTAEELAAYARSRTIPVLLGHCEEGEGAPPLWPWTQVMRAYASSASPQQLQMDLDKGAADIVQAFPKLQEYGLQVPLLPPRTDPMQARFRFFDSFSLFLKNASKRQPLVIILDDIHWADASSLLLLQFVAKELRDMRLLLLVAYRDVEGGLNPQLSSTLGEFARVHGSQGIALPPLTRDEVSRFLTIVTAQPPSPSLVSTVYQRTEGNPFFVTEVVRILAQEQQDLDSLSPTAAAATLPQRVRDSLALRLQTLSEQCRQVLRYASVLGPEFNRTILEAVGTKSQPVLTKKQVARLLSEAESARFVVADPQHVGRYRFSHALVRETLYSSLSSQQRAQLHRLIGEALERTAGNGAQLRFAELALHFSQAALEGGIEKALAYTVKAAEHATELLGYEEAAGHYEKALHLLELRPDDRRRCELLLALGEAQRRAGATEAARKSFRHASELARGLAAPELLARAALGFATGFAGVTVSGGTEDPFVVSLLEDALRGLGEDDSPLRARVLGRLAMELYWSVSQEQRGALSQQAVEMARRLHDPATLAYTLNARQVALWGPDNLEERLAGAEEMISLAKQVGDQELALRGQIRLITGRLEHGDLKWADREFVIYVKRAEELRQPAYLWFVAIWRGMRCWLRGEFAESERWAREAFRIGERAQDPDAAQCYLVQISGFRGAVKSLHDIELPTREFAEQMATVPAWRAGLALLYTGLQQDALARQEFEQLAAHNFMDIPRNADWMITMTNLAQVSAYLRDTARAARIYELLLPYADRCLLVGVALICMGSMAWYLGILATALGRWEEAEAHFATALRRNTQLGAKPILQTKQRHAMMLLARNHLGDQPRALTLLEEALAMAQAINMELTAQHISNLREQTRRTLSARPATTQGATKLKLVQRRT